MTMKNEKIRTKSFGMLIMLGAVFSISYMFSESAATEPNYEGHYWFWEETDYQYASFSGLNISQAQAYGALDAARTEINSASDYHADKVTSGSTNWISLANWADTSKLGQQYPTHDMFNYLSGSDIELNSNVNWSVGTDTTYSNMRAVAIHELGHGVDLLHTGSNAETIMRTFYSYTYWQNLHADDEDKLVEIYG